MTYEGFTTSARLKKTYYRDSQKVMRAIPGLYFSEGMLFVRKSVYTMARNFEDSPVSFAFERVKS